VVRHGRRFVSLAVREQLPNVIPILIDAVLLRCSVLTQQTQRERCTPLPPTAAYATPAHTPGCAAHTLQRHTCAPRSLPLLPCAGVNNAASGLYHAFTAATPAALLER